MAVSRRVMVLEWSGLGVVLVPVTRNSTEVFNASAILTACSALGSLLRFIHDCKVL